MIKISRLDHLVLTVRDIERTSEFYSSVLGMTRISFGQNRVALAFGNQKINLHQLGSEFEPKAGSVAAGSADLCFIAESAIDALHTHLLACKIEIIDGPVKRTGAMGEIVSFYFRDPDANLIEVSCYI